MTYRNERLLRLAKGMPCMNCGCKDDTVVAAHSNLHEHGRGFAHPSHDCYHAWLCHRCHSWLDHGATKDPSGLYEAIKTDKAEMFRKAMDKTWRYMWEAELVKVA